MLIILGFTSDLTRIRFPFICLGFAFTFIGFIIYAAIQDVHAQVRVAYFATFMMCWGTSAPSVLLSTVSANPSSHAFQGKLSNDVKIRTVQQCTCITTFLFHCLILSLSP